MTKYEEDVAEFVKASESDGMTMTTLAASNIIDENNDSDDDSRIDTNFKTVQFAGEDNLISTKEIEGNFNDYDVEEQDSKGYQEEEGDDEENYEGKIRPRSSTSSGRLRCTC